MSQKPREGIQQQHPRPFGYRVDPEAPYSLRIARCRDNGCGKHSAHTLQSAALVYTVDSRSRLRSLVRAMGIVAYSAAVTGLALIMSIYGSHRSQEILLGYISATLALAALRGHTRSLKA